MPSRPPRDSSEAEIDAFVQACDRLAGFDPQVSPEWADGYLTAVAAAPYAVPLDDCLQRLFGDAFSRCFADPDDAAQARSVFAARAAVLADQLDPEPLLDEPDALRLAPLVAGWTDEDRQRLVADGVIAAADVDSLQDGQDWAEGFLAATEDYAADWVPSHRDADNDALLAELIEQVAVLAESASSPRLAEHVRRYHPGELPPTREDLIDTACFAVQDLRVWWLDHAPSPPMRRAAGGPGRNDPCPCGSGRKYKKCHGMAGAPPL